MAVITFVSSLKSYWSIFPVQLWLARLYLCLYDLLHCRHWYILLSECDLSWIVNRAFDSNFFPQILHSNKSCPVPWLTRLCEYNPEVVVNDLWHKLHVYKFFLWYCSMWIFKSDSLSNMDRQNVHGSFLLGIFSTADVSNVFWIGSAASSRYFRRLSSIADCNCSFLMIAENSLATANSKEGPLSGLRFVRSISTSELWFPEEQGDYLSVAYHNSYYNDCKLN